MLLITLSLSFSGAPADLYDTNNPDWAPMLNLGHSKFQHQESRALTSLDRCVRSAKRQKRGPDLEAAKALLLLQKPTGNTLETRLLIPIHKLGSRITVHNKFIFLCK